MKKLLIYSLLLATFSSFGQQVFFETGLNVSDFNFRNNEGEYLENLQSKTQNYITAGYKHRIFTDGLNISTAISYNNYGAIGSDPVLQNFFEWDISYLGFNLGLDYEAFKVGNFAFYISAGGSAEYMTDGVQTINNQVYNVKDVEEFKDIAYFFRSGAGLRFDISDTAKMYFQYAYATGLALNDNNNSSVTRLTIGVDTIGLGIMVDIPCNKKEETPEETETNELETN